MGSGKLLVGHDGIDQLGWHGLKKKIFNGRSWIQKKYIVKNIAVYSNYITSR
jgi:hypothetical protein